MAGKRTVSTKRKAASSTRVKKENKKTAAKKRRFISDEISIVLLIALGMFMELASLGMMGGLGESINEILMGFFGQGAFLFGIMLLAVAFCEYAERGNSIKNLKLLSILGIFMILVSMAQLLFGDTDRGMLSVGSLYSLAANGAAGGGAVGGFIGNGLCHIISGLGAWLVLIVLFFICLVVLTEKSLVSLLGSGVKKSAVAVYHGAEKTMDRARSMSNERNRSKRVDIPNLEVSNEAKPDPDREESEDESQQGSFNIVSPFDSKTSPETIAPVTPLSAHKINSYEFADPQTADYDVDSVPFEETDNERYRSYYNIVTQDQTLKRTAEIIGVDAGNSYGYAVGTKDGFGSNQAESNFEPLRMDAFIDTGGKETGPEGFYNDDYGLGSNNDDKSSTGYDKSEADYDKSSTGYDKSSVADYDESVAGFDKSYVAGHDESVTDYDKSVAGYDKSSVAGYGESDQPDLFADEDIYPGDETEAPSLSAQNPENVIGIKEIRENIQSVRAKAASEFKSGYGHESGLNSGHIAETKSASTPELKSQIQTETKPKPKKPYVFPPVDRLTKGGKPGPGSRAEIHENARKLEKVLRDFGVGVRVTNVISGPRVSRYEMIPDTGVKVSRITSLEGDIKLALAATELRIEAPIPGKSAVGIEIPNISNQIVRFRDILESDEFKNFKSKLAWGVGLDIQGRPIVADISRMPHVLVAGTTGSGKSVGINSLIMSILYRATPEEVNMILIDPKVVELSVYNGIPHLLTDVVTKPERAITALNWAQVEMNRRYKEFEKSGTRNITGYNEKVEKTLKSLPYDTPEEEKPRKLPFILIIIDELSELMMHSKKDVEGAIVSLTQLARAAGIHLVVATQRPSVDVITGLIKSNIPSRIAYRLPSAVDSRTILDSSGAETLLGNGDMLYKPGDRNSPLRVQGAFLSDEEVEGVVDFIRKNNSEHEKYGFAEATNSQMELDLDRMSVQDKTNPDRDDYFADAGRLIINTKKASIGALQRKFKIGFNRAARIMDQLHEAGVVSDSDGTKERQILMNQEQFEQLL